MRHSLQIHLYPNIIVNLPINLRMLRRSTCLKQKPTKKEILNSYKYDQSTQFPTGKFQPQKIQKTTTKKKLNNTIKNSFSNIQQCPTIYLTTKQMQGDFLKILATLQKQYQHFGAVKLVSSQDWNPPFTFKYIDHRITTRNQILQDLSSGKPFQQNIEAHTLPSFKIMARSFQQNYVNVTETDGSQFQQNQFQFWELVSNPKYSSQEVKVQYAADIPTSKYCSAFPISRQAGSVDSNFNYHESYFNLNNTFQDPDSLLKVCKSSKAKISGITQPWVYIGMKFSSFCWHVQDLNMNSLNYNHKGSTKTWYIIPACDKDKMDQYILTKCKYASKGKKQFLHRMTLMVNPLDLIKQGIHVYKINQSKKCYVVTFPKAYHCGFSQGFNVGQAVNYSILDTLPYMIDATNEYKLLNGKKYSVFPVEWIVDENYHQLSSNTDPQWRKVISKQYQKYFVQQISLIRSLIKNKEVTGFRFLDDKKLKYHKNPCSVCLQYLYFSMLRCKGCSKVLCLEHQLECCEEGFQIVIRWPFKQRVQVLECLQKEYKHVLSSQSE